MLKQPTVAFLCICVLKRIRNDCTGTPTWRMSLRARRMTSVAVKYISQNRMELNGQVMIVERLYFNNRILTRNGYIVLINIRILTRIRILLFITDNIIPLHIASCDKTIFINLI